MSLSGRTSLWPPEDSGHHGAASPHLCSLELSHGAAAAAAAICVAPHAGRGWRKMGLQSCPRATDTMVLWKCCGGQLGPAVGWYVVACLELPWLLLLDTLLSHGMTLTLSDSRVSEMITSSFSAWGLLQRLLLSMLLPEAMLLFLVHAVAAGHVDVHSPYHLWRTC